MDPTTVSIMVGVVVGVVKLLTVGGLPKRFGFVACLVVTFGVLYAWVLDHPTPTFDVIQYGLLVASGATGIYMKGKEGIDSLTKPDDLAPSGTAGDLE